MRNIATDKGDRQHLLGLSALYVICCGVIHNGGVELQDRLHTCRWTGYTRPVLQQNIVFPINVQYESIIVLKNCRKCKKGILPVLCAHTVLACKPATLHIPCRYIPCAVGPDRSGFGKVKIHQSHVVTHVFFHPELQPPQAVFQNRKIFAVGPGSKNSKLPCIFLRFMSLCDPARSSPSCTVFIHFRYLFISSEMVRSRSITRLPRKSLKI